MQDKFKIAFLGKTQTGKSTLINKIFQRTKNNLITPIGKGKPETKTAIKITHSKSEYVNLSEIQNINKNRDDYSDMVYDVKINFTKLKYIPKKSIDIPIEIKDVKILINDDDKYYEAFEFYDMPGMGECNKNNTKEGSDVIDFVGKYENILKDCHLIFIIISPESIADQILWRDTIDKILKITIKYTKIYFIYNKIDSIFDDEMDDEKEKEKICLSHMKKINEKLSLMNGNDNKNKINSNYIFLSAKTMDNKALSHIWDIIISEYNKWDAIKNIFINEYDKRDRKNLIDGIINYINKNQQGENKIIPDKIFEDAVISYNKERMGYQILTHASTNSIGFSAEVIGASVGVIGGPPGIMIGMIVGGIIWAGVGVVGGLVDRFRLSNSDVAMEVAIEKKYKKIKNYSFGIKKEFKNYFREDFNNKYNDTIQGKINSNDMIKIIGDNKTMYKDFMYGYDYEYSISGKFKEFEIEKYTAINLFCKQVDGFKLVFSDKEINNNDFKELELDINYEICQTANIFL